MDLKKIAPLFEGWEETMVWSCLQGCMGYAIVDHEETPRAAQLVVGDFCFFAGEPQDECSWLIKKHNKTGQGQSAPPLFRARQIIG